MFLLFAFIFICCLFICCLLNITMLFYFYSYWLMNVLMFCLEKDTQLKLSYWTQLPWKSKFHFWPLLKIRLGDAEKIKFLNSGGWGWGGFGVFDFYLPLKKSHPTCWHGLSATASHDMMCCPWIWKKYSSYETIILFLFISSGPIWVLYWKKFLLEEIIAVW